MRIFGEKTVKIVSASGSPPPNPVCPDPRIVNLRYNPVEFVSTAKCIVFPLKKNK